MSEIFTEGGGCSELEPYALRVTDDSMAPEFPEGCIIIIEPALSARDGQYVVADYGGDTWFRQFNEQDGKKYLSPVNDEYGEMELIGPYQIRGVIIQQSHRHQRKKYPIY